MQATTGRWLQVPQPTHQCVAPLCIHACCKDTAARRLWEIVTSRHSRVKTPLGKTAPAFSPPHVAHPKGLGEGFRLQQCCQTTHLLCQIAPPPWALALPSPRPTSLHSAHLDVPMLPLLLLLLLLLLLHLQASSMAQGQSVARRQQRAAAAHLTPR